MMRTSNISEFYMPMLLNLSDDDKLDIIAKLSVTMHSSNRNKKAKPDIRKCFSGEWENDKSTTEVVDDYRASRHYEHKDLEW